jgi:hypothetical protein
MIQVPPPSPSTFFVQLDTTYEGYAPETQSHAVEAEVQLEASEGEGRGKERLLEHRQGACATGKGR